jgi:hypothetical protein
MQRFGTATAICVLQAIVLGSAQEPTRTARTADVLAGTWLPDPARYEEYWNPKDTNGLQRLAPQPGKTIPVLTIVVRRERITVDTIVDGVVTSTHIYRTDEKAEDVPLADGVLQVTDSHWTSGGLVNHWGTKRDGALLVRGSELWAPSEDGNELTITSVREGQGSKSKTIAVYRRRASE